MSTTTHTEVPVIQPGDSCCSTAPAATTEAASAQASSCCAG